MDPSSAPADAIPLINRQVTCTEEHPLTETSFLERMDGIINSPNKLCLTKTTNSELLSIRDELIREQHMPLVGLLQIRDRFLEMIDANICPNADVFHPKKQSTQFFALGLAAAACNRSDLCPGNDLLYSLSSEMHRMLNGEQFNIEQYISRYKRIDTTINQASNTPTKKSMINFLETYADLYVNCLLIAYFNSQKHHPLETLINNLEKFWNHKGFDKHGLSIFSSPDRHCIFLNYLFKNNFDISLLKIEGQADDSRLYIYGLHGIIIETIEIESLRALNFSCLRLIEGLVDGQYEALLNEFLISKLDYTRIKIDEDYWGEIFRLSNGEYFCRFIVNILKESHRKGILKKSIVELKESITKRSINKIPDDAYSSGSIYLILYESDDDDYTVDIPFDYLKKAHSRGILKPSIIESSTDQKMLNEILEYIELSFRKYEYIEIAKEYSSLIS
jgi:hypothetical protein